MSGKRPACLESNPISENRGYGMESDTYSVFYRGSDNIMYIELAPGTFDTIEPYILKWACRKCDFFHKGLTKKYIAIRKD